MTDTYTTGPAIDVLSFDLDGTLVDSAGEIAEAVNRTLADFAMAPRPRREIELLIGAGLHELARRLLEIVDPRGALDRPAVFVRLDQHYADTAGTGGAAYPGARECLEALRRDGVRLACVTNKEQRHAQRVLEANGLAGYFDLLVGGDTLAWKKPDARVLQYVLAALHGEPPHAAHVGDSLTDLRAARQAGVADWAVPWGYNGGRAVALDRPARLFQSLPQIADEVIGRRHARRSGRD